MKILLATDTWSPAVNGVVRSVQLLRRELLRLGHDVRVLTLADSADSSIRDGVYALGSLSARQVYPGARINIHPSDAILKELERWHPDIIHTQSEFSIFMAARRLSKRCGCPLVHTYHTIYEDYTGYLLPIKPLGRQAVRLCTQKVAEQCSLLLAPTEKVRRLLESYHVPCPIKVVPTGIDLSSFRPASDNAERTALRAQLGMQAGQILLVSVGRLAAEKSHPELLRLLALQPAASRPHLVFVGDGPARAELEQLTSSLGLQDFVSFVGMVPPEDVVRWYQAGDVFVSASQSETQGLTYFEALACGLPVLCRADACLDGVIENDLNGWQWQTDAEFSDALAFICSSDDARRAVLSENAVETAARYSAEHFAQQVLDAYRQTLLTKRSTEAPAESFGVSSTAAALGFLACAVLGTTAMSWGIFTLIIFACKPFAIALYSTGLTVAMRALLAF